MAQIKFSKQNGFEFHFSFDETFGIIIFLSVIAILALSVLAVVKH